MKKGKILYVFVEGADDTTFIKNFIAHKKCFQNKYQKLTCIEYSAGNTAAKILRKFNLFEDKGHDCILIADEDKIREVESFKISPNQTWIAVKEIESWYLAGFGAQFCKNEKIRYIQNTELIAKEEFDEIAVKKYHNRNIKKHRQTDKSKSHIQLINELVAKKNDFKFKEEVLKNNRNQSLIKFYNYFDMTC